jgi:hypothetical protein
MLARAGCRTPARAFYLRRRLGAVPCASSLFHFSTFINQPIWQKVKFRENRSISDLLFLKRREKYWNPLKIASEPNVAPVA